MIMPLVTIGANPHLRWGEWLGIAVTRIAMTVIAVEVVFLALSIAWFADAQHILLGGIPLAVVCLMAALVMRVFELFPSLRRAEMPALVAGIAVTALVLIRFAAFSRLPLGDWNWLGSFGHLTDIKAELPHTELGMIVISVATWVMGARIARHAGNYDRQRAAFIALFVAIVIATLVATIGVHSLGSAGAALGGQAGGIIALALPGYLLLGLFLLSQVRLAELWERLHATGGGDRRSLTIWRLAAVGMTAFSLLFIVIAGAIFYSGAYVQAFNWLVGILNPIFLFILLIISDLIFNVYTLFGGGRSASRTSQSTPCPTTPTPSSAQAQNCLISAAHPISAATAHTTFIIFLVIIAAAAIVVAYVLLRRMLARHIDDEYEEIQERINPRDMRREHLARSANTAVALDVPAAGTVRAVYRDLLGRSAAHGIVRQQDETASEFERRMVPALSGAKGRPHPLAPGTGPSGATTASGSPPDGPVPGGPPDGPVPVPAPPSGSPFIVNGEGESIRVSGSDIGANPSTEEPAVALDRLTSAYERERYGALAATPDRFAQARAFLRGVIVALPIAPRRGEQWRMRSQPDVSLPLTEQPVWDLGAVMAVLLALLAPLYLYFLPRIVMRGNHGLALALLTLAEGVLGIAFPVLGLVLGHRALAMPQIRLRTLNRIVAVIALALGYVVLMFALFAGVAIIFGALGNIFADL